MPLKAEKQRKILDILGSLPPEKVEEIIDFAEYLKKSIPLQRARKKKPLPKLPTFHLGRIEKHAFDRGELYREHLDRKLA